MKMNQTNGKGALPSQGILQFIEDDLITSVSNTEENIQPSSLDLTVSEEGYEVRNMFRPNRIQSVRDVLVSVKLRKVSPDEILKRGSAYLFRLNERLNLPKDWYGYANPKSSTGRTDLHVRLLANRSDRFDKAPHGYQGELWVFIIPKSFSLRIKEGMSFNQMRFFNSDTRFSNTALRSYMKREPLVWDPRDKVPLPFNEVNTSDNDGSVLLSLGLAHENVGWVAKNTSEVLDLTSKDNDPDIFWEEVFPENDHIELKKDSFYILATHEGIRIPPGIASEIVPLDERCGDFRSHYAGFFDPGWGYGENGEGVGDIATLEIRAFEPMLVRHQDAICKFKFELMTEVPDVHYGVISTAHYVGQRGPKLSKHFAEAESNLLVTC